MRTDIYGQQILTQSDLCAVYLQNPDIKINQILVEEPLAFDEILNLNNIPTVEVYKDPGVDVTQFDMANQLNWYMPESYQTIDIAKYVLDQCKVDSELQRAGQELIMFQERGLFPMLRYLKYLVDTMRSNNVIWGVGRGSSIASFVLYCIGVHKINSLHYDLSIDEFLK
jgi:DNA polymerase III alpha subunit